eukprot:3231201-Prymnesium_polylepis.1
MGRPGLDNAQCCTAVLRAARGARALSHVHAEERQSRGHRPGAARNDADPESRELPATGRPSRADQHPEARNPPPARLHCAQPCTGHWLGQAEAAQEDRSLRV